MKKIIAIINPKGSIGKTTTSINLSSGLTMKGKRILLIDLDPQPHSTIGLGIEPRAALNEILLSKRSIGDVILNSKVENLSMS